MANYYISDTHFFHKNVTREGVNFDERPFATVDEMHQEMKRIWNERVTSADHVYILGDMCWKENEDAIKLVSTLKGNKHLILGNHDHIKDKRYQQLFVEICNYKEINDIWNGKQQRVVLSHYPIMFWNRNHLYRRDGKKQKNFNILLYGHLHDTDEERLYQEFLLSLNEKKETQCIACNMFAGFYGYGPVTLNEALKRIM